MKPPVHRTQLPIVAAARLGIGLVGLVAGNVDAEAGPTGLCRTPAPTGATATAADHDVHPGAWSYFGDPRSIAIGTRIFTGCVATDRGIVVEQYDRRSGESFHVHLHRHREADDNPSLALWRGRVYAFYSPHSGRIYPLDCHSQMH